jgi:hypothetical protein
MEQCRLPPELIYAIMDGIGCRDQHATHTLRTRSLVCHSWLPLCQRLLFHIKFITRMRCRDCTSSFVAQQAAGSHFTRFSSSCRVHSKAETMGSALLDLHEDELDGDRRNTPLSVAQTLKPTETPSFGTALEHIVSRSQTLRWVLQLLSITKLEIGSGYFRSFDFFNFISHARGLTSLSLSDIRTSLTDGDPLIPGEPEEMGDGRMLTKWGRLFDLRLSSYSDPSTLLALTEWLLGPRSLVNISHLERLHIGLRGMPSTGCSRLLAALSSFSHFTCHGIF